MFNLCLVTYKNIQRGENIQPLRDCCAKQTEMGYILVQINHLSGWMQVPQTSVSPGSLRAENCRLFILHSIFLRDYF